MQPLGAKHEDLDSKDEVCLFLREICESHFGRGRPCLGCPEGGERGDALLAAEEQEFLISQGPNSIEKFRLEKWIEITF